MTWPTGRHGTASVSSPGSPPPNPPLDARQASHPIPMMLLCAEPSTPSMAQFRGLEPSPAAAPGLASGTVTRGPAARSFAGRSSALGHAHRASSPAGVACAAGARKRFRRQTGRPIAKMTRQKPATNRRRTPANPTNRLLNSPRLPSLSTYAHILCRQPASPLVSNNCFGLFYSRAAAAFPASHS